VGGRCGRDVTASRRGRRPAARHPLPRRAGDARRRGTARRAL